MDISMSPRLCFVGLYGGEAKVGANYGIEWEWGIFPHPYFNTSANGDKICETEFYCWAPDAEGLEIKAEFQPYFEATVLNIITIKATFTTIELKKGTLQFYPPPVMWL